MAAGSTTVVLMHGHREGRAFAVHTTWQCMAWHGIELVHLQIRCSNVRSRRHSAGLVDRSSSGHPPSPCDFASSGFL